MNDIKELFGRCLPQELSLSANKNRLQNLGGSALGAPRISFAPFNGVGSVTRAFQINLLPPRVKLQPVTGLELLCQSWPVNHKAAVTNTGTLLEWPT